MMERWKDKRIDRDVLPAPLAQVIVVPLRANVNLKSVTVEELVERRSP